MVKEKTSKNLMCPLTESCSFYKKWSSELPRENRSFHNIISIKEDEHSCNAIEPYYKTEKEVKKDLLNSDFKSPNCALIESLNYQSLILKKFEKLLENFPGAN